MKTLFLDLSTKSTGWAIGEDGKLIDYGCVTSSSTNVFKRISVMQKFINEQVEKYKV